jgi:hypothetical protein
VPDKWLPVIQEPAGGGVLLVDESSFLQEFRDNVNIPAANKNKFKFFIF